MNFKIFYIATQNIVIAWAIKFDFSSSKMQRLPKIQFYFNISFYNCQSASWVSKNIYGSLFNILEPCQRSNKRSTYSISPAASLFLHRQPWSRPCKRWPRKMGKVVRPKNLMKAAPHRHQQKNLLSFIFHISRSFLRALIVPRLSVRRGLLIQRLPSDPLISNRRE